jgi:hypothetical protein
MKKLKLSGIDLSMQANKRFKWGDCDNSDELPVTDELPGGKTTYRKMLEKKDAVPKNERSMRDFCAHYIYNGCKGCSRMHVDNIDWIRNYMDDGSIKSKMCKHGSHCLEFLCRFEHQFDHVIFGKMEGYEFDEAGREWAKARWREEKHKAYNIELMNGTRKPKNPEDFKLLEGMKDVHFPVLGIIRT